MIFVRAEKTNQDREEVRNFYVHCNVSTLKQAVGEQMNSLDEEFAEVWEIPKNAES